MRISAPPWFLAPSLVLFLGSGKPRPLVVWDHSSVTSWEKSAQNYTALIYKKCFSCPARSFQPSTWPPNLSVISPAAEPTTPCMTNLHRLKVNIKKPVSHSWPKTRVQCFPVVCSLEPTQELVFFGSVPRRAHCALRVDSLQCRKCALLVLSESPLKTRSRRCTASFTGFLVLSCPNVRPWGEATGRFFCKVPWRFLQTAPYSLWWH